MLNARSSLLGAVCVFQTRLNRFSILRINLVSLLQQAGLMTSSPLMTPYSAVALEQLVLAAGILQFKTQTFFWYWAAALIYAKRVMLGNRLRVVHTKFGST